MDALWILIICGAKCITLKAVPCRITSLSLCSTLISSILERDNHQEPSFKTYIEKACMSALDLEETQDSALFNKTIMIALTNHSKNQQERVIKMLSYLTKRHHPQPGQHCWSKSNTHT